MKAIKITTGSDFQLVDLGNESDAQNVKEIQKHVKGHFEIVRPAKAVNKGYFKESFCFVCNEEGLVHNLHLNILGCRLYGGEIRGDILILKIGYNEQHEFDIFGLQEADILFLKETGFKKLFNDLLEDQMQAIKRLESQVDKL